MATDQKQAPLTAEQLQQAATELFGGADFGVFVKGVVMGCEDPAEMSGVSAKSGKAYRFISRRIQLSCGAQNVVVSETRDSLVDFKPVVRFSVVEYKVLSARMDGPQLILRVV